MIELGCALVGAFLLGAGLVYAAAHHALLRIAMRPCACHTRREPVAEITPAGGRLVAWGQVTPWPVPLSRRDVDTQEIALHELTAARSAAFGGPFDPDHRGVVPVPFDPEQTQTIPVNELLATYRQPGHRHAARRMA